MGSIPFEELRARFLANQKKGHGGSRSAAGRHRNKRMSNVLQQISDDFDDYSRYRQQAADPNPAGGQPHPAFESQFSSSNWVPAVDDDMFGSDVILDATHQNYAKPSSAYAGARSALPSANVFSNRK